MKILGGIKNLFKRRKIALPNEEIGEPFHDWHVLLLVFFILLVAIGLVHYLIFLNLEATPAGVADTSILTKNLHKKDLQELTAHYRQKSATLEHIISSRPQVVDPSR